MIPFLLWVEQQKKESIKVWVQNISEFILAPKE